MKNFKGIFGMATLEQEQAIGKAPYVYWSNEARREMIWYQLFDTEATLKVKVARFLLEAEEEGRFGFGTRFLAKSVLI